MRKPLPPPSDAELRRRAELMAAEDRAVFDAIDRIARPCERCGCLFDPGAPVDGANWTHATQAGCDQAVVAGIMDL